MSMEGGEVEELKQVAMHAIKEAGAGARDEWWGDHCKGLVR